jgi:hypothetical protein
MKKTALIIMIITALGTIAHGGDNSFYKTFDWGPERPLICYPNIFDPLIEADDSGRIFVVYTGANVTQGNHSFEMHSYDYGNTWSDPYDIFETEVTGARVMALYGENLHVIDHRVTAGLIYRRTTDAGYSWSEIETLATDAIYGRLSIYVNNEEVFCTYNNPNTDIILLRSFDNGHTWEQPLTIVEEGHLIQPPYLAYSDGIWHFAYSNYPSDPPVRYEIYYMNSYDDGDTWSVPLMLSTQDGFSSQWVNLAVDENGIVATTWMDYKYGSYLGQWGEIICRVSTDYGLNWGSEIRINNDTTSRYSDVYVNGNSIFVTYDNHERIDNTEIYLRESHDSGRSWGDIELVSDTDERSYAPGIAYSNPSSTSEMLHIVWYDIFNAWNSCTFYRRKTQQVTGIEDDDQFLLPDQTEMLYNYPNPFNTSTIIRYRLADDSNVRLSIYNLLGEKVADLVDERQNGGEHEITWDASPYSSGIYFYKLTADNQSFTKRMVLLR